MYLQLYSNVLIPNYAPYKIYGTGQKKVIVGTNSDNPSYFNPFQEGSRFFENLINDALKMDTERNEQVIDFCNKYGLPSISGYTKRDLSVSKFNRYKDYAIENAVKFTGMSLIHSPVRVWYSAIMLRFYFKMYGFEQTLYVSDDYYLISKRKFLEVSNKYIDQYELAHKNNQEIDILVEGTILEEFSKVIWFIKDIKFVIKGLLEENKSSKNYTIEAYINAMISKVYIKVYYINDQFRQFYRYKTLQQAVGLYFMNLLLNKKGLKQCAYPKCGKFFLPTHGRQKYCPPPENSVRNTRSSCENNHRLKRYIKRKKTAIQKETDQHL